MPSAEAIQMAKHAVADRDVGKARHIELPEPPPHTEIPDWADAEPDNSEEIGRIEAEARPRPKFVPIAIDDVTVANEPAWLIGGLLPARIRRPHRLCLERDG